MSQDGMAFSHIKSGFDPKLQYLVNSPEVVQTFRDKVRFRIQNYYNWEWITDFYEDMFKRIYQNETLLSYDDFLNFKDHNK